VGRKKKNVDVEEKEAEKVQAHLPFGRWPIRPIISSKFLCKLPGAWKPWFFLVTASCKKAKQIKPNWSELSRNGWCDLREWGTDRDWEGWSGLRITRMKIYDLSPITFSSRWWLDSPKTQRNGWCR
jgi:hypothetical protein